MKFGNLVSYTGKYLSTAKGKATGGNLVFAKITGSTTLATDHADYDKDGYYIYAGGAEALLVDLDTFKSLKSEVKALQDKVGDLVVGDVTYNTVAEYVTAYVASKITASVRDAATATDDVVPTEKAVRTAIDAAVSTLGTVMEFVGVTTTDVTVEGAGADVIINGETKTAAKGDVVVFGNEEYVWDGAAWHEIGQVKPDEAVTSLGGVKGDVTLGTALKVDGQALDVKLAATQGNVTLDVKDGLKADVAAEDIAYSNTSHIDDATTVTNIKEALDEIFDDELVIANSLVDINTRLTGAEGDIADINTAIEGINKTIEELDKVAVVDGDANDFVEVAEATAENGDVTYTVTAKLAEQPARVDGEVTPDATGLATDAYVAAAIANALAWEVLTDPAE